MVTENGDQPNWISQGKTIKDLIEELQTFDDQDLEVQISVNDGKIRKPISLVKKSHGCCVLVYCGD